MADPTPQALSPEDRATIRARAEAATDGPWDYYCTHHPSGRHAVYRDSDLGTEDVAVEAVEPDAAFIVAARADVPVLVAALRAVLDLHRPEAWRGTNVLVCAHCRPAWTGSNRATYPCDTVRAVTAHIDTTKEKP